MKFIFLFILVLFPSYSFAVVFGEDLYFVAEAKEADDYTIRMPNNFYFSNASGIGNYYRGWDIRANLNNVSYLMIKNTGECVSYKTKIVAYPAYTSGFLNNIGRSLSILDGSSTYTYTIGTIEKGETFKFTFDKLVNSTGHTLTKNFRIGVWKFSLNYCGTNINEEQY